MDYMKKMIPPNWSLQESQNSSIVQIVWSYSRKPTLKSRDYP